MISGFLLFVVFGESHLLTLKTFEEPTGEEYLAQPFASCFAENGKLYVIDPSQGRVLTWHADGRFDKGFAKQGEGPGELLEPIQIAARGKSIYVWQRNGRITQFDLKGVYRDNFSFVGPWPRRFAMMDEERALINYRQIDEKGRAFYVFDIRTRADEVAQLQRFHNKGFLEVKPGNNNAEILAYMADVDIQEDPSGGYWYGFGYEKKLYFLDKQGRPKKTQRFDLKTSKPTDEERDYIELQEVDFPDGTRRALKDLPGLKIYFNQDKAYFTQFLIKGEKVAFILTTLGGSDGTGDGDSWGSYQINDLNTGARLARGSYQLPPDSQVHYRNGRIVAFIISEAGDYEIREVTLKGL